MSRREGRDSHGKRLHSSRFDRGPSPKRSRRDGRADTERKYPNNSDLEVRERVDGDQKRPRRFQETVPVEAVPAPESKEQHDSVNKELEKKPADGLSRDLKHSSDPVDAPRSRSHFQHDERGSGGQSDHRVSRRDTEKRRLSHWDVPKEQSSDKFKEKSMSKDFHEKEEKVSDLQRRDENQTQLDDGVWRHDKYHELAADVPPSRIRPAFREQKLPTEDPVAGEKLPETMKSSFHESGYSSSRREERGGYPRRQEITKKTFAGGDDRIGWEDRSLRWGEARKAGYQSRERFGSGGAARGRDRYNGRYGDRNQSQVGGLQDRWKHDLFDEANRSPTPKNEEDEIAKVEALLAS